MAVRTNCEDVKITTERSHSVIDAWESVTIDLTPIYIHLRSTHVPYHAVWDALVGGNSPASPPLLTSVLLA